jgi:hypothetical protein
MARDFRRMRDLGANAVYLGHNVAGDVSPNKWEPGLSFAIYYALEQRTPAYEGARAMYEAVTTALAAAREVGLGVVLPVGYQIQMGPEWSERHPEHLRRKPDGTLLLHWDFLPSASPYSPRYREDIAAYYRWVDREIVRRHPHILALNLADEPMGTDFSPWARMAFQARYGQPMEGAEAARLGEFLSEVIADYAAWSAATWQEINPRLWTMMTFHIERTAPWLPSLDALFRRPPANFIFSADTHLHDAPPELPLTPQDVNLLHGMARTFGWLSRVYRRPMMLWTAANAWGLAGQSSRRGGIEEATRNVAIAGDLPRQAGGRIAMLMAWGWNIQGQGVYRDEGHLDYLDREALVGAVARALAERREGLSTPETGRPARAIHVPEALVLARLGAERVTDQARPLVDLTRTDFIAGNTVYLTGGRALEEARAAGVEIVTAAVA